MSDDPTDILPPAPPCYRYERIASDVPPREPTMKSPNGLSIGKAAAFIAALTVLVTPVWIGAIQFDRATRLEKRVEVLEAALPDMKERLIRIDENVQQLRRDNRSRAAAIP